MSAIDTFAARARSVSRTIVLPEGQDPRVVVAAEKALAEKVVGRIIVLGSDAEIDAAIEEMNDILNDVCNKCDLAAALAATVVDRRLPLPSSDARRRRRRYACRFDVIFP